MRTNLLVAVTIALTPNLASAGSSTTSDAVTLVTKQLIQPLAAKDRNRSRFSRARPPATEWRVRMLDEKPREDSAGNSFLTFAIDARSGWDDDDGASWSKAAITGCVYPERGEVFIKRGNAFHPAAAAVGKKTKAASEGTCHAAAKVSVR